MKKNAKTLTLLTLATGLLLGLGSCDSGNTDSSDSSSEVVKRIGHDTLPYVQLGKTLDLDQYVYALLDSGEKSTNYEVTCSNEQVTITGHTVKADKVGKYTLDVSASGRKARITLDVRSKKQIEIIDFLKPLEENPQNYTVSLYSGSTGYWTLYHNPDYVVSAVYGAIEDEDYDSLFNEIPDSSDTTTFRNMIIAKLSDGNGYFGYVGDKQTDSGEHSFYPTFFPGYSTFENYYMTMALSLDGADVELQEEGDFEGELLAGASFEANLLNYGLSQLPERYTDDDTGEYYEYEGALFNGLYDYNQDGTFDELVFDCLVSSGDTIGSWCTVGISNIGTTSLDFMEDISTNNSYIPSPITADEIVTAYTALANKKNYTVTWTITSADSSYKPLDASKYGGKDADACGYFFGGREVIATELFTKNGTVGTISVDGETSSAVAYWDDGTDSFTSQYDKETSSMPQPTKTEGERDVYNSGLFKYASSVTSIAANSTNWASKSVDTTTNKVTFTGDVGDNDGQTATNALFEQIVSQSLFFSSYGESFTEAEEFSTSSGEKSTHALTCYSDYNAIVVNTSTNEVSVDIGLYMPVGLDNGYISMKIEIGNIDTTTFDFSALNNGISGFPTLTAAISEE